MKYSVAVRVTMQASTRCFGASFVVMDGSGCCIEDDTRALDDLVGLRPDTGA